MNKLLVLACVVICTAGCSGPAGDASHAAGPAHVDNPVTEDGLTRVTLTEQAERRLGIETRPVELRSARGARTLGGEVIVPPGRAIVVSAPVAGRLLPLERGTAPRAGARVASGAAVFRLVALPTEDGLLSTREAVGIADAQLANAQQKAERAERLFRDGIGSLEMHQDAQANFASADAAAAAARARLGLVSGVAGAEDDGLSAILLRSPETGRILRVLAGVGQTVATGTPLFEVVATDPLWVRVPVYAGDLATLDRNGPVLVTDLGGNAAAGQSAQPIEGPPTANRDAASVDLYYTLPNPDGRRRPGERVGVTVTLGGKRESPVVPASAVIRDPHGGAWVYVAMGDHVFVRRRVEVLNTSGSDAVLGRGPDPGTVVVSVGVAELYGTEFGAGH